jgi:cytosine/adenosine deaminase-related metal-dependent hydrolase
MHAEPYTLTARWIFPVEQPPLPRGTITIQGDRIIAVTKAGTTAPDIDLGNVAILPGLVNAHTHLDLSDAQGQCPPTPDFTAWLCAVIAHRRRQTPEDVERAIGTGLSQCLRYGTTLVGDIAAGGKSWEQAAKAPLRAVVFYELLGLAEERARDSLKEAQLWIESRPPSPKCREGLSPHAPYSAGDWLLRETARYTSDLGLSASGKCPPVAIHVAETAAELGLLEQKTGPFVDFLAELGAWHPSGLVPKIEKVFDYGYCRAGGGPLFVHGNYLSPATKLPGCLVYCPRTHAAFGHPSHPFRQFLANGTAVALGTDSLASNPDLDMLAEVRFLHRKHPDVPGAVLLRLATLNGASALGWQSETGSLSAGKSADLVVLPLPNEVAGDPHRLILESSLAVKAVMFRGELSCVKAKPVLNTGCDSWMSAFRADLRPNRGGEC